MKRFLVFLAIMAMPQYVSASDGLVDIPVSWRWLSDREVAFSYDGSYSDSASFSLIVPSWKLNEGKKAPLKQNEVVSSDASERRTNVTYSPDSSKVAYTLDNNLWIEDAVSGNAVQLTDDGSELILNGYASWVYYEEIFGRPSKYRAFWWSPDSKKIGFYRFDNSKVPMFPIYSPFGQHGELRQTRYPKAGDPNPSVKVAVVDVSELDFASRQGWSMAWADFDEGVDQYFGIPFWDKSGDRFFVSREPRVQQTLELYCIDIHSGKTSRMYCEHSDTWLEWIENAVFTQKGLYMVRNSYTGWDQAYFLPYEGGDLVELTSGHNHAMVIERVDERKGLLYFSAKRDSDVRTALYCRNEKGDIRALTDTSMDAMGVKFSPDGKYFVTVLSNMSTPAQIWVCDVNSPANKSYKVADEAGPDFDRDTMPNPELVYITTTSGYKVPGAMTMPRDFNPELKYPVVMEIYGGPGTEYVKDRWRKPDEMKKWFFENGFIRITADASVSGHNGKSGMDLAYKDLHSAAIADFVDWAHWLQSLPYVKADRIGVEGFSFGGANTARLIMEHSDCFHSGIAGGGVYDWMLYDSHYTERFMNMPENNPEGYRNCRVMDGASKMGDGILKITHGTGDDNVHFQHTLQLIDAMQRNGKLFELMIYPDGMHGYRGEQGKHSDLSDQDFWRRTLKD